MVPSTNNETNSQYNGRSSRNNFLQLLQLLFVEDLLFSRKPFNRFLYLARWAVNIKGFSTYSWYFRKAVNYKAIIANHDLWITRFFLMKPLAYGAIGIPYYWVFDVTKNSHNDWCFLYWYKQNPIFTRIFKKFAFHSVNKWSDTESTKMWCTFGCCRTSSILLLQFTSMISLSKEYLPNNTDYCV